MNNASLSQDEVSSLITRLKRLAGNLWWTWNQDCQDIFHELSPRGGQKIGCNGGLNLSILDGWYREGYGGSNGFAIGADSHLEWVEEQDRIDSENLYRVLQDQVIPCFYERDAQGIPRRWIQMIRHAMATLVPRFTTWRMVQEYTQKYYLR